jgi:hypothetical protein
MQKLSRAIGHVTARRSHDVPLLTRIITSDYLAAAALAVGWTTASTT